MLDGVYHHALTQREAEAVTLAMDGLTNAEIGARMGISPQTVKVHMREACDRLGVSDQAPNGRRLVAALIKGGWLSWTGKRL